MEASVPSQRRKHVNLLLAARLVLLRTCTVTFTGVTGIRHGVNVEADSLIEAAVLAAVRFPKDFWGEGVGPGTVLDIEVSEPSAKHSLTLQQVESGWRA